jgi:hypothetical protein
MAMKRTALILSLVAGLILCSFLPPQNNSLSTSKIVYQETFPLQNSESTFTFDISLEWPESGTNEIAIRAMQKKIIHQMIKLYNEFEYEDGKTFNFQKQYAKAAGSSNPTSLLKECSAIVLNDYCRLNYSPEYGISDAAIEVRGQFESVHNDIVSYTFSYMLHSGNPYLYYVLEAVTFDLNTGETLDYSWEVADVPEEIKRNILMSENKEVFDYVDNSGVKHSCWFINEEGMNFAYQIPNYLGDVYTVTVPWDKIANIHR